MIAIVDDDENVRESLAYLLETEGRRTALFASVDELLRAPEEPEVLLIDHDMPGTTGLAFIEQNPGYVARVPTVVISAHHALIRERALAAGARAVLPKPFDVVLLAQTLRSLAAR